MDLIYNVLNASLNKTFNLFEQVKRLYTMNCLCAIKLDLWFKVLFVFLMILYNYNLLSASGEFTKSHTCHYLHKFTP